MKLVSLALAVAALALLAALSPGVAMAGEGEGDDDPPVAVQPKEVVDDNADTRVEVQLVVLGVAAATVVGAGVAAYMVRRRLGLTAYDPAAHGGGSPH